VKRRFAEIGGDCGGCVDVEMPSQSFTGERLPAPTVIARRRGLSGVVARHDGAAMDKQSAGRAWNYFARTEEYQHRRLVLRRLIHLAGRL
jgi:hypothetical protein